MGILLEAIFGVYYFFSVSLPSVKTQTPNYLISLLTLQLSVSGKD